MATADPMQVSTESARVQFSSLVGLVITATADPMQVPTESVRLQFSLLVGLVIMATADLMQVPTEREREKKRESKQSCTPCANTPRARVLITRELTKIN